MGREDETMKDERPLAEPAEGQADELTEADVKTAEESAAEAEEAEFEVIDKRSLRDGEPSSSPPAAEAKPAYVQQLEDKVLELESRLEKTYAAHRNREQEMERIRERLERDREKRLFQDKARLFGKLLEPLDNLDRCQASADLSGDPAALVEGVRLVSKMIQSTLSSLGLERFDPLGEPFDPALHEAVSVVPTSDPKQHDVVHAVCLAGYRLGDHLVRPARVVVTRRTP
jgi:molecular chaperone GrpE